MFQRLLKHTSASMATTMPNLSPAFIGDDISEIATAVKSAIQQCCIQLKSKIVKRMQTREQQERKRSLSRQKQSVSSHGEQELNGKMECCRYIPDATGAVYDGLKQMTEENTTKRKRYIEEDTIMLEKVSKLIVTKETLK